MRRWLRRARYWLQRDKAEADLAEELELHRQMKQEELEAQGLAPADASAASRHAVGNDLLARERSRDVWIASWLQDTSQDLRFGLRMLVKERRFALTAIVTLALGIAVCNAAFSFANAAVFRDLPFESPDRLITVRAENPRGWHEGVSYLDFLEFQRQSTAFDPLCADFSQSVNVSDGTHAAERLSGAFLTYPTFRMLGVAPVLGRDFVAEDDRDGAPPVVILGYGIWQSRYGGDQSIVGRLVRVNDLATTVIGVMPQGFGYPLVADLWLPMAAVPAIRNATWTSTAFGVVGRLKPGVDRAQARSEIETIAVRTLRDHKEVKKDRKLSVTSVKEGTLVTGVSSLMWALLGAGIVVLFVASANVANLMLARSWHRSREIAVRLAMGATRWRVIRQVLIECGLIAGFGGLCGVYLSFFGFQAMSRAFNVIEFGAPDRPRKPYWFDTSLDGSAWLFVGAAILFASLGAGLIPALQLSKTGVNDVLKDGRLGPATRSSRRWAGVLMIGQLAVALMLLVGGGLFARSYVALYNTNPVIDTKGIVTMRVTLPQKYGSNEQRLQFIRALDERMVATSEFSESTIASDVPLMPMTAVSRSLAIESVDINAGDTPPRVLYITTGPRFFETLRFPVAQGRAPTAQDSRPGSEGAIVNQRFVSVFLGDGDPIGKRIRLTASGATAAQAPWLTIVGVVPTLPDFLPNGPDDIVVYAPLLAESASPRSLSVMVRAASKGAAATALRREVSQLDPDLPVYALQTLEEVMSLTRSGAQMVGSWFQALALVAVVLACVGLYSLTAHNVAQRTPEIGLRMALGAKSTQVVWLFARRTLGLVIVGLALGLAGALASSRLLTAFLGDVGPRDTATLIVVSITLAIVSLLATILPARRASRVDPLVALRTE